MSRSLKRNRSVLLQSWVTPDEAALIRGKAAHHGSVSALLRNTALGYRAPRSKGNLEIASQLLGAIQAAKGEWNKIGSNINQIAKEVNIGRAPRMGSLESEWLELSDRVDRDLLEFRTLLMKALGQERNRPQTDD